MPKAPHVVAVVSLLVVVATARCGTSSDAGTPAVDGGGADDATATGADASSSTALDAAKDAPTGTFGTGDASLDAGRPDYEAWANWPMPNPSSLGLPNSQSYDTSVAGVVLDRVTNLEWQATSAADLDTVADALAYCQALVLDGKSDWRLPSRIELVSIYDSTRLGPGFDPVFVISVRSADASNASTTQDADFWTSSLDPTTKTSAWLGAIYWESLVLGETDSGNARCVRGGPAADVPPPARYEVRADTVYDTGTRLTWQRDDSGVLIAWADAPAYCASLHADADAGDDWRLPSLNELQTIYDENGSLVESDAGTFTEFDIDLATFPSAKADYYWSSASFDAKDKGAISFAPSFVDTVSLDDTPVTHPGKAFVRCVK